MERGMEIMEPKIITTEIVFQNVQFLGPVPIIVATFDDGTVEDLFEFFPEEMTFTPAELRGLNKTQALQLKTQKMKAYLHG
jgi:hypothetical protein